MWIIETRESGVFFSKSSGVHVSEHPNTPKRVKKKEFKYIGDRYFSNKIYDVKVDIGAHEEAIKNVGVMTLYSGKLTYVGFDNLRISISDCHNDLMNKKNDLKTKWKDLEERYEEFKKLIEKK